ncbi:MAG TPA: redoxin domain-containing protein [Acidimicrobiia bacterium]|nr:redoxin domain-containing protein [Acidimicrobiia bacterium]
MSGRVMRWVALAVVGGAIVFAVVLASRFGSNPGLVESPLIGQPAPEFELDHLDGSGRLSLSDLSGEIVVLNFFASWCFECREEHDDLVATSDSFADQGVTFVQVAYQEDPDRSLAYLAEAGTSQATRYLADPGSRAAIAYGVFGIPETFFINPDGVVVGKIIGEADAFVLGATIDAIRRGESPGQKITGDTQQRPDA